MNDTKSIKNCDVMGVLILEIKRFVLILNKKNGNSLEKRSKKAPSSFVFNNDFKALTMMLV